MKSKLFLLPFACWAATVSHAAPLVLENSALRVEIAPESGRIGVVDKVSGQIWQQPVPDKPVAAPVYRVLSSKPGGLELARDFAAGKDKPMTLRLRFTLPGANAADLRVEATADDLKAPCGNPRFLEPFVLDAPRGVLAVADYCNGHLYPLDTQPFPRGSFAGDRLDMPWVALCDLDSGRGYMLLLETSDDCDVRMEKVTAKDGRALVAPQVTWRAQKGAFGYPRSVLYHFEPKGGYVALCKFYRQYAKTRGLIVPFTEKLKKNPNLTRLFGAPDVWGNASLAFAREAKAAGVDKMLIHGRPAKPADMRAINDLGYLTSEYDNYTDILEAKDGKIDSNHAPLPDHAVLKSDQQRMTAWLTWDKKTQYMKRCPTLWVDAAKATAERVLKEWPFVGRFIDVTTAEGLYECYDPKHPMTRTQKRECGPALLRVFRDHKLVMGGEHGIWWCVPVVDYIEGMMSGGYASWPAGHLIHPKSKDEEFEGAWGKLKTKWESYAKWGIGHEWRAPLWELVFHDCIVTTWYWGDASDWLLDAAPEITPKKDAYNVLYGTIPLLWADAGGSWVRDRALFLRTYRNTCKLHEILATQEMVSHEFLTADHAVQATKFSDGTECVVNFGPKPAVATIGDKDYLLPQNGWAVKGPRIEQSLVQEGEATVTRIRTPGYAFSDRSGVPVTLRTEGDGRIRITTDKATDRVNVPPVIVTPDWKPDGALLYRLDDQGRLTDTLAFQSGAEGAIEFGPAKAGESFMLIWGKSARQPDLRVAAVKLTASSVRQGDPLRATATITNAGAMPAPRAAVEFALDGVVLRRTTVDLKGRAETSVIAEMDTAALDGEHRLTVTVNREGRIAEISKQNNQVEQTLFVAPDWSRWPNRKLLRVGAGGVAREDEVVVTQLKLPDDADPTSVRVAETDVSGQPTELLPSQLEGGELAFILRGKLAANESRRVVVAWREGKPASPSSRCERKAGGTPAVPTGFWRADAEAIVAPGYEARFENGTIAFLAPRKNGVTGRCFIKSLMLSSKETGWSEEPGTVEKFEVEYAGPVRTIIRVRKALKAGVVYDKRYTFYPSRFDLDITVNKPAGGLYSRAYYAAAGTYADDKGLKATVDGKGDGENIYGQNKRPKWYAVYASDWAHSCVALSPSDHIAYWDAGSHWGGIGLTSVNTSGIRMSYVIHPGAADAKFAEEDYRRLTAPVTVTWE
ncbi:MAG: hypothetical protein N2689_02820 [Verrucomicrobiae bacterium]|nr:hypothetical protein [Verrucomicrobiae bacterium]